MKSLPIYRDLKGAFAYLLLASLCLSGCIRRDMVDCEDGQTLIKVTAASIQGLLDIAPEEVTSVRLYIFEHETQTLLQTIHTQLNVAHTLSYPGKGKLYAVAIANVEENQSLNDIQHGGKITEGNILLRQKETFDGQQLYAHPDDLLWGDILLNNEPDKYESVELQVKRVTGRVVIRVTGLQYMTRADADPISIVLGTPHHTFSFEGKVSPGARAQESIVAYYKPTCGVKPGSADNIIESPDPASSEKFFNVLATPDGCSSTLRIYQGDRPLTPIINSGREDGIHIPLRIKNGILNSMEIIFNDDMQVSVLLNQAHWSDGGNIGKEW